MSNLKALAAEHSEKDSASDRVEESRPRTPRPYYRDGVEITQDHDNGGDERRAGRGDVGSEQRRDSWDAVNEPAERPGHSGQGSVAPSESDADADDERPRFVKALPPATLRPRKGLKTGEKDEDVLLTPSMLSDEGRPLSQGYFKVKGKDEETLTEQEKAEQEKLARRRLGEFARRVSEVVLMGVILITVLSGHGVLQTAMRWMRELLSHIFTITALVVAYPLKLSVVDAQAQHTRVWQRFKIPVSFDPATVLYPPLLPVLVALSIAPANEALPSKQPARWHQCCTLADLHDTSHPVRTY
jgi:hypothetical protein